MSIDRDYPGPNALRTMHTLRLMEKLGRVEGAEYQDYRRDRDAQGDDDPRVHLECLVVLGIEVPDQTGCGMEAFAFLLSHVLAPGSLKEDIVYKSLPCNRRAYRTVFTNGDIIKSVK